LWAGLIVGLAILIMVVICWLSWVMVQFEVDLLMQDVELEDLTTEMWNGLHLVGRKGE